MAKRRMSLLVGLFALSVGLFLLWGLRAPYGFILSLRMEKLVALILVGASTGAATVIFQTIANNRLLTPGIVGFDALFVFLQTSLIMALGSSGFLALNSTLKFLVETCVLVAAAMVLFGFLLRRGAQDIIRMILTGVILGVLLRGLASFAQRLLDPSEFAVVQISSVASFNGINDAQLAIASVALICALGVALQMSPKLDVAALGRAKARTLGLGFDPFVLCALGVVAVMVSVSTALVGPVAFLGLLASSLAYATLHDHRHMVLIPAAAIIGSSVLVAGQAIFERVLGLQSALGIVVEFVGGLLFLALVLRKRPS